MSGLPAQPGRRETLWRTGKRLLLFHGMCLPVHGKPGKSCRMLGKSDKRTNRTCCRPLLQRCQARQNLLPGHGLAKAGTYRPGQRPLPQTRILWRETSLRPGTDGLFRRITARPPHLGRQPRYAQHRPLQIHDGFGTLGTGRTKKGPAPAGRSRRTGQQSPRNL